MPRGKTTPRGPRAREPGEPRPRDEVPWHDGGLGPSRVVRVERVDGRWTRVRVRWQAGCRPVPGRPDPPESRWSCPTEEAWIDRATFEEQQRRWRERGG